jgi:glycosyltransferase involved in cell wall biosynthesis
MTKKTDLTETPLISIAMAVRNGSDTVGQAIRSLVNQTYSHWELILIDDGSTDGTVEVARQSGDVRVRVIADGRSRGLAARLNEAIDHSHGVYLARLDADDIAYPERLSRQLAFLQANHEVDLVGSAGVVFTSNGEAVGILRVGIEHAEICRCPWSGFPLAHPTWMGRTKWFRHYRYDSRATKAQDMDLLLRAYQRSIFAGLSDILIGYRQDRISIRKSLRTRLHVSRALLRAREHLPTSQLINGLVAQLIKTGGDVASRLLRLDKALISLRGARVTTKAERDAWTAVWSACNAPEA